MVEFPLLPTVPVVTLKVADAAAAATVTVDGTARLELLFDREIPAPPGGAIPLN
jgi:hypothetical protein